MTILENTRQIWGREPVRIIAVVLASALAGIIYLFPDLSLVISPILALAGGEVARSRVRPLQSVSKPN